MKAWGLDVRQARARARSAAGTSDQGTRVRAYVTLCEDLGEAAKRYADPVTAARMLVREAAKAYAAEITRRKGLTHV